MRLEKNYFLLSLFMLFVACSDQDDENVFEKELIPSIESFSITLEKNPSLLHQPYCVIDSDMISITLFDDVEELCFIADFKYQGNDIKINDNRQISGETINDFSVPVQYSVFGSKTVQTYNVVVTKRLEPCIYDFKFPLSANVLNLITEPIGEIECDTISFIVPHIMNSKKLIADFQFSGETVTVDGVKQQSGITVNDFSKPIVYKVEDFNGAVKKYVVKVYGFTGLPIVYIDTENKVEIKSKDIYINARIKIIEDLITKSAGDVFEGAITIKGRGNSTWDKPKKPYKLKFESKVSLLGEPKDREWVLLANYFDKTFLRNSVAFFMGYKSNLEWTPHSHFVELIINGTYNGTYLLCEQVKISKNRVNITDNGYLLEIDAKASEDDITFKTGHLTRPVSIKDPKIDMNSEQYYYIRDYICNFENVLFSGDFMNEENGYRKYIDIESFVDWYLINEISKNNDAKFYSSCFMNIEPGGKLKMGPLWDFDLAFGNVNYNDNDKFDGLWIIKASWFERLFKDPAFVSEVNKRFQYYYNNRYEIYRIINEKAQYLNRSIIENNNRWGTLYKYMSPNSVVLGKYQNEVQNMKVWLDKRFEWLKAEFESMGKVSN